MNSAQPPSSPTQLQSISALASSSLVASAIVDAYSSTHMANPPASVATSKSSALSLRKAGWSSLPAGLREEVYKELLLVDMRQEQKEPSHRHLHLDILRVNKEICKEASAIPYLWNSWVQNSMGYQVVGYVESSINQAKHRRGKRTVVRYPFIFSRVAALNINVCNKENPNLPRQLCIVSSSVIPQICRIPNMPPTITDGMPPIGLALDLPTGLEGAMWDQKAFWTALWKLAAWKVSNISKV